MKDCPLFSFSVARIVFFFTLSFTHQRGLRHRLVGMVGNYNAGPHLEARVKVSPLLQIFEIFVRDSEKFVICFWISKLQFQ